jgi:VPS28 protein
VDGRLQVGHIKVFMDNHKMNCTLAEARLLKGIPATQEHGTPNPDNGNLAAKVADCVAQFIAAMDALKLNMAAVDQLSPVLGDLLTSLNRVRCRWHEIDGAAQHNLSVCLHAILTPCCSVACVFHAVASKWQIVGEAIVSFLFPCWVIGANGI